MIKNKNSFANLIRTMLKFDWKAVLIHAYHDLFFLFDLIYPGISFIQN